MSGWEESKSLSDRIRLIISENDLKQKEFAQSLNVTDSYISKLLRDESGVSNTTAMLIEERYGYSAQWIMEGTGLKMSQRSKAKELTPIQRKLIAEIEQMDLNDLAAVWAFISTYGEYKKSFGADK